MSAFINLVLAGRDLHTVFMSQEDDERWESETSDYCERLLGTAESSPRFAGAEIKYESRELIISGVGPPSDEIAALIDEAPSSIRVTWKEVPYTLAELTNEVLRIMDQRPRIYGGGARDDGAGISFRTTDAELLASDDPRQALGARYPVSLEFGGPLTLL